MFLFQKNLTTFSIFPTFISFLFHLNNAVTGLRIFPFFTSWNNRRRREEKEREEKKRRRRKFKGESRKKKKKKKRIFFFPRLPFKFSSSFFSSASVENSFIFPFVSFSTLTQQFFLSCVVN